jgi:hypothetical protein
MLERDSLSFIDTLLEIERTATINYYEILDSLYKGQEKTSLDNSTDELSKFVMNSIIDSEAIARKKN